MRQRNRLNSNASDRAANELEYVITNDKKADGPVVPTVTAEEAMSHERVFEMQSQRDITRVLFISTNSDLLNPVQQSLDGYINISDLFDEVHILILRTGIAPVNPVLRAAENVWIYTAGATHWWQLPAAGMKLVESQLSFASGFRPDLIVARDPMESALVAQKVSKKFNRPTQLHILEDHSEKEFLQANRSNIWRRFIPFFTIRNFQSIRTTTDKLKERIEEKYHALDVETLPRLQNYEALVNAEPNFNLKDKYREFSIIILYIGDLSYKSTLHKVIDAAQTVLQNRRIGLVVVGTGEAKQEFIKRAKARGVEKQLVFENEVTDVVSYLRGADMLIVSDTDMASEEVVLQGAALGVPIIMTKTEQREDVFVQGESAYICEPGNIKDMSERIQTLLYNRDQRIMFAQNAQSLVEEKFHFNPKEYQEAYRLTIEKAFFTADEAPE